MLLGYAFPVNTTLVAGIKTLPLLLPPPPHPFEVQAEVLKRHRDVQEREPLIKPCVAQDAPSKLEPSHCSPNPIASSPHPGTVADTSTVMASTLLKDVKNTARQMTIKNNRWFDFIHFYCLLYFEQN